MPLLRNKFQPYFPDPDSPNRYQCGPEKYCWPVQGGDRILTQFYQTPCNPNLVCNSDFQSVTETELICNEDFVLSLMNCWITNGSPMPNTYPGSLNGWNNYPGGDVFHTPGNTETLGQAPIGLTYQAITRLYCRIVKRSGDLTVWVGFGVGNGFERFFDFFTPAAEIETEDIFIYNDNVNDYLLIMPGQDTGAPNNTGTWDGDIKNISVKQFFYDCWDINGSWIIDKGRKWAFHVAGTTGNLVNNTANYVNAGGYYKASVTVSTYVSGSVDFYVGNILAGTISANGTYTYYVNPTLNGTIIFTPTSDFVGNLSDMSVFELKNDYALELIDSNGSVFDVSDSINYYEDYVTVDLDFNDYELADGCYNLNMYDYCVVTSDNLAQDPSFVDGYTYWTRNNAPAQYDDTGDQMKFIFDPFGQGFTDYVTNGDFSGGATGWTLGANWSVVGGKAVHTPGSTAALSQTMTLPTPGIGTNYSYYVGFTISNWTVGSVTVKLGNAVNGTSYTWKGNDTMIQVYVPRQSGSVDITFTPTSTFDGQIDDIAVVLTSGHTAFPILTNVAQPLFTPGTYQTEWEIIGSSDPNISVRTNILGATPLTTYESTVGVQSFTQSYALTGGNIQIVANFSKTDPNYLQVNYVAGDITVDNINVQKVEPFEATYVSECLNYSTNPIPRTKMIIGYCDQNALGFDFVNTGFKLMHRAEIRSLNPNYPSATEIMKSGRGNDRTVYGELQKYWQVTTDFASETFHDTMAAILICDHLEMGDTEGTVTEYSPLPEEYSPNWNGEGAYSLATATFQVRVKENGQKFNRHT